MIWLVVYVVIMVYLVNRFKEPLRKHLGLEFWGLTYDDQDK